jgi:hypothetical protein
MSDSVSTENKNFFKNKVHRSNYFYIIFEERLYNSLEFPCCELLRDLFVITRFLNDMKR